MIDFDYLYKSWYSSFGFKNHNFGLVLAILFHTALTVPLGIGHSVLYGIDQAILIYIRITNFLHANGSAYVIHTN